MAETEGRTRRSAATKNKAWSSLMTSGKHKPDDLESEETPVRPSPRSAPRSKKPKLEAASPASKPTKIETPEKKPEVPAQAPRLPQTVKTNENGVKSTAAFGKEQIDNIEKEMFRTYMSNESEEFSDSEEADESLQELLDEGSDEDFIAKPRRSYTKRSTNTTTTSIKSARGRAGILKNQPFAPRFSNQNVVAPRPTTESSNPRIVPRPTLRYASAYVPPPVNENRPIKMVLLRQPGKVAAEGNGDNPRMPMTISSMQVQSTKEIDELNKKFGQRLVPGDSVQKFNNLINTLVTELKNAAEDRERLIRNHQELTEQMNLSHSTTIDIKESRIRQLENYVSRLQNQITQLTIKLQSSYSQHESSEKTQAPINEEGESDE